MSTLTMRPRDTCHLCASRLVGLRTGGYRINRHSLTQRHALTYLECPECGPRLSRETGGHGSATWALDDASTRTVRETRQRRWGDT